QSAWTIEDFRVFFGATSSTPEVNTAYAATFRARPAAAARSLASRAPQLIMLKKRKELLKVPLAPF
ncbi:MAG: hypothetical protein J6A35_06840, partial [Paludibacteraceae bacterium]|nr:hypothetical protein [Paludibacteraceae bacterium]